MIRIAIVGDIGAGKTYIANRFDYPVFNADKIVSEIYNKDKNCFNKIKKKLKKYDLTFPIKKENLIKCILDKKNNLKKISRIIHPIVRKKLNKFLTKNKKKNLLS